ncbi:hypothetical protein CASFOL_036926 [Castilleja foliolosa]|uniref:SNF2 N-terminal domain-containing protein n=1 Tax=Castilleja foliolosa TaxID=1961234 RepID=A0ABD3BPD3_9LAMI
MTIRRSLQRQTARQPIDRPSFGLTPTMAAMTLGGTEFAGLSICDWDIKIEPNTFLSSSDSLSQWEAEFARLSPSVDIVVYNGNADTGKRICASEFYEEGGCVMLQVLLSSPEAVIEDIDMFSCIRWQSIVIDEYHQLSQKSIDLELIKILTTDSRILLLSGQIKKDYLDSLHMGSTSEVNDQFGALRDILLTVRKRFKILSELMPKDAAFQIVNDELMMDGNPRLNLDDHNGA